MEKRDHPLTSHAQLTRSQYLGHMAAQGTDTDFDGCRRPQAKNSQGKCCRTTGKGSFEIACFVSSYRIRQLPLIHMAANVLPASSSTAPFILELPASVLKYARQGGCLDFSDIKLKAVSIGYPHVLKYLDLHPCHQVRTFPGPMGWSWASNLLRAARCRAMPISFKKTRCFGAGRPLCTRRHSK